MKQLQIDDKDIQQFLVVMNLLKEGKFEIKGEAFGMAYGASYWCSEFYKKMKAAEDAVVEDVVTEDAVINVKPKRSK